MGPSLLLALLAPTASAADGVDGHHFQPIPTNGGPLDLVEVWQPVAEDGRSFAFQALFDASGGSLVRVTQDWDGTTEIPLLDDVFAVNVGARAALSRRLALTATLPVYLSSVGVDGAQGAGVGDLRLALPVGLLVPERQGFSVGVVPRVDLPSGDAAKLLGGGGVGVGALAAAGWRTERVTADVNVGYAHNPVVTFDNYVGGDRLLASIGGGYAITPSLGVRLEGLYEQALAKNVVPGTDSPGEALLSVRGHQGAGFSWEVGGGAGLTDGVGAPTWRAFAGVGWARIVGPKVATPPVVVDTDPDHDGVLAEADACPDAPETVNAYKDDDGCADALADWTLALVNDQGAPVIGALVTVDGKVLRSDVNGVATLTGHAPEERLIASVTAVGYHDATVQVARLAEGPNRTTFTPEWLPGNVRFFVHDAAGRPMAATLTLYGPTAMPPLPIPPAGNLQTILPPGQWRVLASAPGLGGEGRVLEVDPTVSKLTIVELGLSPPVVSLEKGAIVLSDAALFNADEAALRPDADRALGQVLGVLVAHPELQHLEIQGHTDNVGDDAHNLDLSQRRADAVRAWLLAQGIPADRLVAKGYGETAPVRSNATEAGRAANRRVELRALK